jgi:hypothetical protein
MTKIGIVNIANRDYVFKSIYEFETFRGLELIDFCDTDQSGYSNFSKALNSDELDFVWFLSGGTSTIDSMNQEFQILKRNKTRLIGSSDATHAFIHFKDEPVIEKYYYLNFLDFIKYNNKNTLKFVELLKSPSDFKEKVKNSTNLSNELSIIGGHSIISAIHLGGLDNTQNKKYAYFWEHHAEKFESLEYFIYWLKVLGNDCRRHKIYYIIIGYSYVYDSVNGQYYDYDHQQVIVRKILKNDFVITFLDQRIEPISLY